MGIVIELYDVKQKLDDGMNNVNIFDVMIVMVTSCCNVCHGVVH
jgi:hypothetical protein